MGICVPIPIFLNLERRDDNMFDDPRQSKIEVRHTCIIIHNYRWDDKWNLQKLFSIYDKVTHKYNINGIYYDAKNKDLYLPAGMDFGYIVNTFGDSIYRKVQPDPFEKMIDFKLKYKPRDEEQMQALAFCVGKDKYVNNNRCSQLAINLNTGKGKTYVAIATTAYYSVKSMIIVNTLSLMDQWEEKILEYTDTDSSQIYRIVSSGSIGRILRGNVPIKRIRYFLCSHATISAYANKHGWEKVRELFILLRCGIKIFDEAHLYYKSITMIDFFSDTCKTYYLTATPNRSDANEDKIYQLSYSRIPRINLFKEEENHTDYIAVFYNSHPNAQDIYNCQNAYGFDRTSYANYISSRPNYYRILMILLDMNLLKDGKILIYIGTNYSIARTYDWIRYNYPSISVGIFSSLVPKEDKFTQLDNKIILTTTKSAGAAMDIQGLRATIVLAEPFKSPVLARQTLGRTRDDNTEYYDVVDMGFDSLLYYYKAKKKIFRTYAKSMKEMGFSDREFMNILSDKMTKAQRDISLLQNRDNLKQVLVKVR